MTSASCTSCLRQPLVSLQRPRRNIKTAWLVSLPRCTVVQCLAWGLISTATVGAFQPFHGTLGTHQRARATPSSPDSSSTSTVLFVSTTSGGSGTSYSYESSTPASTPQRTLYDVLGASMTDTKAEIKQKYVQLAKQSHPDALLHPPSSSTGSTTVAPLAPLDFNEIATAYQILSDTKQRRRYDRSLQAANVTEHIAAFCMKVVSEPVAELAVAALDKIALPFLKRTTATTLSAYQAAVQSTLPPDSDAPQNDNSAASWTGRSSPPSRTLDLSKTWESAVQAATKASHALDAQEWSEQSDQLHQQAVHEYKQAVQLRVELQRAATERVLLALHTAHAGLTASEATLLLESFQQSQIVTSATASTSSSSSTSTTAAATSPLTSEMALMQDLTASLSSYERSAPSGTSTNTPVTTAPSIWQRLNFLRQSIEKEITVLQNTEAEFLTLQQADQMAQETFQTAVRDRLLAHAAFLQAQETEAAAKAVYDAAVDATRQKQTRLDDVLNHLHQTEHAAATSSNELERLQSAVSHQSETVRNALCKKQKALARDLQRQSQKSSVPYETSTIIAPLLTLVPDTKVSDAENAVRLQTLDRLRQQERDMSDAAAALEVTAAKLLSRANKLKQKVEQVR